MVEKDRIIRVVNRDSGGVGYRIPDMGNLRRQFQSGETKELTFEELQKLSWVPGGDYILRNCLVMYDEEAVEELLGHVEPEYYYTRKDIKNLLEAGTMDQFLDCLDFAPAGVLDMIKTIALELPLTDTRKIKAIEDKLHFNVTKAMELAADEGILEKEPAAKRRAAPVKETPKTERRYKTIDKKNED